MPDPAPVPPALKSRVEALLKGTIPSAPPGPGAIRPITWVMLVLAALPSIFGTLVELMSTRKQEAGCMGAGLVVGGLFFVIFLICLGGDLTTPSPKSRTTPERGVKAFYGALRRKQYGRAFACLSPLDRIPDLRPTLPIERLQVKEQTFTFKEKDGFARYWRAQSGLATGLFGGYHKTIQAKILGVTEIRPGLAAADLEILMSGYPTTAYLGLFLGAVPIVLLIQLLTRREKFQMRKLLVRKDGLWWMVNGEFTPEGDEAIEELLDRGGA